MSKERARMAEVDLKVKMRELQQRFQRESTQKIRAEANEEDVSMFLSEDDKLSELFRVEDEIADMHGIETEHFLLLREEYRKVGGEQKVEDESTKVEESVLTTSILEMTTDVEKQPDEMTMSEARGGWSDT